MIKYLIKNVTYTKSSVSKSFPGNVFLTFRAPLYLTVVEAPECTNGKVLRYRYGNCDKNV